MSEQRQMKKKINRTAFRKRAVRRKLLLLVVFTIILVSACGGNAPYSGVPQSPTVLPKSPSVGAVRVVRHVMGETEVPVNPQRVVTLDTGHLANALALGIQPIGSTAWYRIDHQTGLGPVEPYLSNQTQELTILGYGFSSDQVSLEKILLLKPDLIVGNQDHKAIYDQLSRIAPTVLYDYSDDGDGWQEFMRSSAEALGKTQEAEKLLSDYHQRTQELRQKMGDRASITQVSVIHPLPSGTRLMYRDSFGGSILQDVGLSRPPEQDKDGTDSLPVSFEFIPQMGGDVIFVISFMDEDSLKLVKQLQNNSLWSQLQAVKYGKVYPVNAEHWYGDDIIRANLVLDDLFKYLLEE